MKLMTLRMPTEEKARLEQLAKQRNVTLSHALREGVKLFLEERDNWPNEHFEQTKIVVST